MQKETKILALIFLLALLLRLAPTAIDSFQGPDPFFHMRLSSTIVEEQGIPEFDRLSLQGRQYSYAPLYHALFASLFILTGIDFVLLLRITACLYGAMAVFLVYCFAKKLFQNKKIALFSAFAIALAVLHVARTASYSRPDGLTMLVVPAVLLLFCYRKFFASLLLTIPLVLLHPLSSFYLLALLLFLQLVFFIKKEQVFPKQALSLGLAALIVFCSWIFLFNLPISEYLSAQSFDSVEFARFSFLHIFYFFAFSWMFALIGLFKLKENLLLKSWLAFSIVFAVLGLRLAIFLTIPMALLAGFGFNSAMQATKKYPKAFALLAVLLAIVAVIPSTINLQASPLQEDILALKWLNGNSAEDSSIMSTWDKGHLIAFFAERKAVIDGYFEFAPQLKERNQAMQELINSADCEKIKSNTGKFEIDFFFVASNSSKALSYQNGLLEADCEFISNVYSSGNSRILKYN